MANMLSTAETECTRCNLCATACPMSLVRVGAKGPRTKPVAERMCILCGHCIAACPSKTLRHSKLPDEECLDRDDNWRSDVHTVEQLIKGRRSIRRYEQREVGRERLLSVMDLARYSPTGMNRQSVKWKVVYEQDEVKKVAESVIDWMRTVKEKGERVAGKYNPAPLIGAWDSGKDPILRNCPHLVIAYGQEGDQMAYDSSIAALTTIELAAVPHGLGTCWAGFLHVASNYSPEVRQQLDLPEGNIMHGALMIGFQHGKYYRIPPRKPLDVIWQ